MAGDKHLISIINEVVDNFINEIKEYGDEDIISTNNIDFQHEYSKLNQQLFNNELPEVSLRWDNRKTSLGHVHSFINRFTGERRIDYLALSAFYKTSYRQFKNVLAHEMVHVKQLSRGEKGNHGYSFSREADRINAMGIGYAITEVNTEKTVVSDETKAKTLIGMIFNIDGRYYLNVTTPSVYQAESDFVFNLFQRLVDNRKYREVEITAVESRNPQLMAYRISRSFKRGFTYSQLSDELLEQLLDDKIIKNVKIKSGVPMAVSEDIEQSNSAGAWEEEDIV